MITEFLTSVGTGLSSAIGWTGDVVESLATGGALNAVLPVIGIAAGLAVFSWGLNKITGLFRNIG